MSGVNGKYTWDQTASDVDAYIIDTYVLHTSSTVHTTMELMLTLHRTYTVVS